jgi:polyisoprenoid-binding protein YceI
MSRRILIFGGGALAFVAVAIVAVIVIQLLRSDDPNLATEAPQITPAAGSSSSTPATGGGSNAGSSDAVRKFVIVPAESSAKYVVQETLRGLESTAVGTTSAITGEIYLTPDGLSDDGASKFQVDLSTLKSDEGMRDNFIKQNTLQTNRYQFAEFTIKDVTGFPESYAENTQVELTLSGTMKIHNVEKDVSWKVLARQSGNTLTATADTDITFTDFGMSPPNVQIAKAKDGIHIQVVLVAREA